MVCDTLDRPPKRRTGKETLVRSIQGETRGNKRKGNKMRGTDLHVLLSAIETAKQATEFAIEAKSAIMLDDVADLRKQLSSMSLTEAKETREQVERDAIRDIDAAGIEDLPAGCYLVESRNGKRFILSAESRGPAGVRDLNKIRLFARATAYANKRKNAAAAADTSAAAAVPATQ